MATGGELGAERDADGHGDDLGGDEHGAERDVAHMGNALLRDRPVLRPPIHATCSAFSNIRTYNGVRSTLIVSNYDVKIARLRC